MKRVPGKGAAHDGPGTSMEERHERALTTTGEEARPDGAGGETQPDAPTATTAGGATGRHPRRLPMAGGTVAAHLPAPLAQARSEPAMVMATLHVGRSTSHLHARDAMPAPPSGGRAEQGRDARVAAMDRRHALKVMALAAAAPGLASCGPGPGDEDGAGSSTAGDRGIPGGATAGRATNPNARGDPWDPDLLAPAVPWERQLDPDELESLAALCDVILPADNRSPSASEVGAHDFIDEWVSAPYEALQEGGVLIRGGLAWLDREARARFGNGRPAADVRFRTLSTAEQHAVCDDIRDPARAEGGPFEAPSLFFDQVRRLTLTAFWTTAEGMDDLRYIGNTPLTRWDPPPPEVLRHIGLA